MTPRSPLILLLALLLSACGGHRDSRTRLVIQRFFGACEAEYGQATDPAKAAGECGIMTTLINRFEKENPDVRVVENVVFWPGYDQLTAQLASNDAPDLVTMHGSVISDYQTRGLIEPLDRDLARIGVPPSGFTAAARAAVTVDGRIWGMPIDSWAPLWHVNMNLFRKAGLVRDGKAVLPRNPAELIAQGEQFRRRTGKPYLIQVTANEYASFTRNFYTFVMQQGGQPYADPRHARFQTPEARNALQLFKDIYDHDLTTRNQDYSAAVAAFLKGEGGIILNGTWMVGDFEAASRAPDGPLSGGYAVFPYPQLFPARDVTFADGHAWVMPANPKRPAAEREAALRFLKFFAAHDFDWSRTGHMPAFAAVIDSAQWRALPHRGDLASLARNATPLPKGVRRQFTIETIVGQEAAAAISGEKPIPQTLADMERRVNDVLEHL
jgi:multiple sugar transport system substrate-binding protein